MSITVDNEHSLKSRYHRRDIISINDFKKEEILEILHLAKERKSAAQPPILQGKILASCFYEPSTRTRLSFESAMISLGGAAIGFADGETSSLSKHETLYDTIKVIGQYADVIVLRHPLEGAARLAAEATDKPVINAGDGANQHPTQTLIDLFSINETQGRIDNMHIAFTGDLKYGRAVRSMILASALFNMRMYFIAHPGLELPESILDELKKRSILFSIHTTLEEVLSKVDILYMTRIQKERISSLGLNFIPSKKLRLTSSKLQGAKSSMRILHPLPRVDELDHAIDHTPHAYYFEQAKNGLYVRETLLRLLLS